MGGEHAAGPYDRRSALATAAILICVGGLACLPVPTLDQGSLRIIVTGAPAAAAVTMQVAGPEQLEKRIAASSAGKASWELRLLRAGRYDLNARVDDAAALSARAKIEVAAGKAAHCELVLRAPACGTWCQAAPRRPSMVRWRGRSLGRWSGLVEAWPGSRDRSPLLRPLALKIC